MSKKGKKDINQIIKSLDQSGLNYDN